jgi:hypothetical protein
MQSLDPHHAIHATAIEPLLGDDLKAALLALLAAAEAAGLEFACDPEVLLAPHVRRLLANSPSQGGPLLDVLTSLGWDCSAGGAGHFSSPVDARALAARLKVFVAYQVMEVLGEGTYSRVYRARCRLTGDTVTIKRLRVDQGNEGLSQVALREVSMLRELSGCTHVVK